MGAERPIHSAGPLSAAHECARRDAAQRSMNRNQRQSRLDRTADRSSVVGDSWDCTFAHVADRSGVLRYAFAVLATVLAVTLQLALMPLTGNQFPFLTFSFELVFVAWFCGPGPSLLALGLSLVSIPLVLDPIGYWTIRGFPAQLAFLLYVPVGVGVALLGGSMRTAQLHAQASEALVRREQEALRASEQRFRTMVDAAPVLFWVSDADHKYTYFNRAWLEFTGPTTHHEAGEGWVGAIHPEDLDRCLETRATAHRNRQPLILIYRLRRQDGEYRWVLEHGVPWATGDGVFLGYIGSGTDVTEQRRLEEQRNQLLEELEARQAFTEAILRQVPAGILVADARTERLFLSNHEAHRIVQGVFEPGQRMEDYDQSLALVGLHEDGSRFQPDDWPLARAMRRGEVVKDEEIEVQRSDGSRLTISVNAGPVKDQAGGIVAAVAAFHDITDRKQADRAIREKEERFRILAEAIPQIVWISGPNQSIVYLNRRWFEYTGLSEEETYRAQSWESVVHPDDLERVKAGVTRCIDEGRPFEDEYRLKDRDGSYRWFLGRAVRVTDQAGRVVAVMGTATDIDDRKRAEQSACFLADASATLAALVDEASTLQQVARLAVPHFADWCVVDMAGADGAPSRLAVAHADPGKVALAEEMQKRYPPHSHSSNHVSGILKSGTPKLVSEVTDEMLATGTRDEEHFRLLRELGLRSYMGVPLPGRDGSIGVISFIASESGRRYGPDDLRLAQDLACRAAVAVENARLYEQSKEADRRKDEFLDTLAHELRNPLASILNVLHLMTRSRGADHEADRAMAERLVKHLARLVDDLLDVSRINKGKIELRKEVVELTPIVDRVVQVVSHAADERRHDLMVSLPEAPVLVNVDPTRLEQILWNLLSNAVKYTEPGGQIAVTARRHEGDLVLHVRDTGIGIPAEVLPHVFEMFSRIRPATYPGQGGVGIGLGLIKSLVELHGGTIEAHSDGLGKGSEFLVRMPVVWNTPAPLKPDPPCAFREPSGAAPGRQRILIVDDNKDAATSLASLLSMLDGHTVEVAHDGPSAIAMALVFDPEIVILDIGMPRMDGYELARRLRRIPQFQETRLLALSGWGRAKDREKSRDAGIDHHLVKPLDYEVLRDLLSQRSAQQPSEANLAVTGNQRVP